MGMTRTLIRKSETKTVARKIAAPSREAVELRDAFQRSLDRDGRGEALKSRMDRALKGSHEVWERFESRKLAK
jgi:hypothetical protein